MSFLRRLGNVFRSDRHARDLDRELAFHLQERTDDLVSRGMSRDAAGREARRRFGNYGSQKEHTRDVDIFAWLDSLIDDLRYAVRMLAHARAFSVVAILSLALGIGANTAIFTLINAVMLRSLPVAHPEELVQLSAIDGNESFTNPVWEQIRDHQTVFNGAFAYATMRFNLTSTGEVRHANGNLVSGDFFRVLGVQPVLGRVLSIADDQRGCPAIGVLSFDYWQNTYGGDASVIGKTITLNSHPFQIVGVAQAGFTGLEVGRATHVFLPICDEPILRQRISFLDHRSAWWLTVIARSKPELPHDRFTNDLNALAASAFAATVPPRMRTEEQREYLKTGIRTLPAANGLSDLRHRYSRSLVTLMGIVGLVLLIACANVANLLLARATAREREMAIRVALGAARRRLMRQLLTESVLLSLLGAVLGLLLARWGSRILVAFLSPAGRPISLDLSLDQRVLAFSTAVAVLTGLAFGLAPAWRSARVAPNSALKANARGVVEGQRRFTLGKALVVAQIAISLTLIVGAGLLLGTFRKLVAMDAGFEAADVLIVSLDQSDSRASSAERLVQMETLLERMRALPGVTAASLSQTTPLGNSSWNEEMLIDGFTPKSERDGIAFFNEVSPGYFKTMGTPVLAGRDFDRSDRVGTTTVAVINETMARHFYGVANPIGRTYRVRAGKAVSRPVEIVGVVKDAKYQSLREKTLPTAYVTVAQDSALGSDIYLELRIPGAASTSIPTVRSALIDVNPKLQMSFVPFATHFANSLKVERVLATLSAFFGGVALLLASMGLYGVISYSVARRRSEIGVRMALGAGQRRIASMVMSEVGGVLALGFVVGLGISVATTRLLASLLFELKPNDPSTFAASIALLGFAALLAAYLPARRAARVDPMEALREE
jgi:predicted permease